jgi:hypothetical protein
MALLLFVRCESLALADGECCFSWESGMSRVKESEDLGAGQGLSRQRDTAHWAAEEQPEFIRDQLKEF